MKINRVDKMRDKYGGYTKLRSHLFIYDKYKTGPDNNLKAGGAGTLIIHNKHKQNTPTKKNAGDGGDGFCTYITKR